MPEDAPPPLQQPGVVVSHAILVAEILSIDVVAALDAVNAVHDLPSALPRVFVPEDELVMTDFLERLGPAIDDAVDPAGRPAAAAAGRTLADSEHVRAESDGTPTIRSRSFPVAELRTAVEQALELVRYAHHHALLVRLD